MRLVDCLIFWEALSVLASHHFLLTEAFTISGTSRMQDTISVRFIVRANPSVLEGSCHDFTHFQILKHSHALFAFEFDLKYSVEKYDILNDVVSSLGDTSPESSTGYS